MENKLLVTGELFYTVWNIADLYFGLQFAAIWAFSAKESNTLQLQKQTKSQKQEMPVPTKLFPGTCPPLPPAFVVSAGSLPVKDTVSSWEQDFMEDHFCHDAPDRPDVHYQTPGD